MSNLNTTEIKLVRALLANPAWLGVKTKWLMDFPRPEATSEVQLIRNAVGFDYWQRCIARLESYAEEAQLPKREKNQDLEYDNDRARPPA